ncbi:MAG: hypothetical protein COB53_01895 [Elusimicrobia bacterium]|nr:MAG: hypothetical protein COB53_01895 [Elusimicrobiota bacterium]
MFTRLGCPRWLGVATRATAIVVAAKIIVIVLSPTASLEGASNYDAWGLAPEANAYAAFCFLIRGGLLAPIAEEAIFRGAFLGSAWALLRRIGIKDHTAFWTAALPVSLLFVCLHETVNPTFIWIRMSGALALACMYRLGGLRAAVAMHALGNFFWASLIVADQFFGYDGMLAVLAIGAMLGYTALRESQADTPDLAPSPELTVRSALSMALMLVTGALTLGVSPLYGIAALGLLCWSMVRLLSQIEIPATPPVPVEVRS